MPRCSAYSSAFADCPACAFYLALSAAVPRALRTPLRWAFSRHKGSRRLPPHERSPTRSSRRHCSTGAPPLRSFPALRPARGPARRPQGVGGGETRRRPILSLGTAAARWRLAARPARRAPGRREEGSDWPPPPSGPAPPLLLSPTRRAAAAATAAAARVWPCARGGFSARWRPRRAGPCRCSSAVTVALPPRSPPPAASRRWGGAGSSSDTGR